MAGKFTFAILTGVVLLIGYYSYVEFPEDCDFPIGMRLFYSLARLTTHVSELSERLGGSYVYFFRLIEFDLSPRSPEIEIFTENFNEVQTTIFKPKGILTKELQPAIIFFHGGGWAVGSVGLYAAFVKALVQESKMMIVFPEYRLAPEYPYPVPLDDCVNAALGFVDQAEKFGIDKKRIIFAGDSAGGNLAAAVSLRIAKSKKTSFMPCYVNLIYPMLQISNFQLPSYQQNHNAPLVFPDQPIKFALFYMGLQNETSLVAPMLHNYHMKGISPRNFAGKVNADWVPKKYKMKKIAQKASYVPSTRELEVLEKYKDKIQSFVSDIGFSPLSATDEELRLFPPTHLVTSEYDVLRDESIILYERMKKLGLDVSYENLQFAAHGVWNLYGAFSYEKLEKAGAELVTTLKRGIENC